MDMGSFTYNIQDIVSFNNTHSAICSGSKGLVIHS